MTKPPWWRWLGGVAIAPSGTELAAAGTGNQVALWDITTAGPERTLRGPQGTAIALAFNHDGSRLAVAGTDRSVRIWDPRHVREPVVITDERSRGGQRCIQSRWKITGNRRR